MRNLLQDFSGVLNSRRFFWAVLIFFLFESFWIALSAAYPMAFDENFHYGLIKLYAHYWLPFLTNQPPNADAFGAVPRDPSYLYHYSMSFPYRLIAQVTHSELRQIILLRLINIALFATGLILFRKLLLRVRLSVRFTNLILALFVLIPVVPLLAGQVNYDNMLLPLVAWACLLTLDVTDQIRANKLSIRTVLTLAIVCFLTTLVKYEFMPVFAGIVLFLLYIYQRSSVSSWRKLLPTLWKSWQKQPTRVRLILVILFVISVGLFAQRDGVNLVQYHTFSPECSKVLNVKSCSKYSPWAYNYYDHREVQKSLAKGTMTYVNPVSYTGWWVYWLWYRSFFAVNGPTTDFTNYPPLPLPALAGMLIGIFGIVAIALRWRSLFKNNPYMLFFLIVSVIYLMALWFEAYTTYRYTGVFEIMNGRYVFPILLLIAALIAKSIAGLLRKFPTVKVSLALIALVFFLEGGGFMTFIARSNEKWDWPNSNVIRANNAARKVLQPVVYEGSKTYYTKEWFFN